MEVPRLWCGCGYQGVVMTTADNMWAALKAAKAAGMTIVQADDDGNAVPDHPAHPAHGATRTARYGPSSPWPCFWSRPSSLRWCSVTVGHTAVNPSRIGMATPVRETQWSVEHPLIALQIGPGICLAVTIRLSGSLAAKRAKTPPTTTLSTPKRTVAEV